MIRFMQEEHITKRELKQLRKLEKLQRENLEKKQGMMKWIVISVASVLFFAFFVVMIIVAKSSKQAEVATALSSSGWVRGDKNARVNLVEFSDLQCPACKAYEPVVEQVLKDLSGKVKLTYKHFPLTIHKNSMAADKAAEAAGAQDKFWEMHDLLFNKQEEWSELDATAVVDKYNEYAKTLGLDVEKFKLDYNNKDFEKKITDMENEGTNVGVLATPTFFINGVKVENAPQNAKAFEKLIEDAYKKK